MARSIPALVKPELLVWAREAAGIHSMEAAEQATKIDAETLAKWEAGDAAPSIAQLRKLGIAYKRPLAVFFLDRPPQGFDPQRAFRRLPGIHLGQESPALLAALRLAMFRRDAALELLKLLGEEPPAISPELRLDVEPEKAGQQTRKILGISWETQIAWGSDYEALTNWRLALEDRGVLVFQASGIRLAEMRGVCVPDYPLPVVVLNSKDAPHGRIFSAVHEFAHILLQAGGHRTRRMADKGSATDPIEVAANALAAATLLPAEPFLELATRFPEAAHGEDADLQRLTRQLKVSPEVILRRLVTLKKASRSVYHNKRAQWGEQPGYAQATSSGWPSVPVRTIANNGRGFIRLVFNAYDQRLISTTAASDYLDVKPRHFSNIRHALLPAKTTGT